ncbi:MAG TPA: ATP-binding protein [Steroidobacteraceae bacterium]|nr:ATP-binding protein [Steroidobacteraceae bacterium]
MLIEFQVRNYRSFRENQVLSMIAGRFTEHTATNTVDTGLTGFDRFIRSAVVYGANAAGKTNLLRALQLVQSLVVNSATATPATPLPYDPFKFAKSTRTGPSEFRVTFVELGIRYEYGFSMDAERICDEWLIEYVNPRGRAIFERRFNEKKAAYEWKFSTFLKGRRALWSEATRPNALFLSTAIQLNSKQLLPVFEWFQKRLVVITGFTTLNPTLTLKLLDSPEGKEKILPFLREADLGIMGIDVRREPLVASAGTIVIGGASILEQIPGSPTPNLVKITVAHAGEGNEQVGLDLHEESAGTQILFRSAGAWLQVFENGEVLLVDEIDTSLHPLLTRFLINKFHDKRSNRKNAQLIFSTHNTTFLAQDLFRRDQIWFVEKAPDGTSKLYPLTDFRPRNDEILDSWYLRGRYGALPVLDEMNG